MHRVWAATVLLLLSSYSVAVWAQALTTQLPEDMACGTASREFYVWRMKSDGTGGECTTDNRSGALPGTCDVGMSFWRTSDKTYHICDPGNSWNNVDSGLGANHNLLDGSVHPDTAIGTAVRGDVIAANASADWARLGIGGDGTLARSDGTDIVILGAAVVSASAPSTTTGVVWLDTGSSAATGTWALRTETSDYTVVSADQIILVDASASSVTVTLPLTATNSGRWFRIKKIDATGNSVTIDGNGSETIDGNLTVSFSIPYTALGVLSDGTEWWIF